MTDMTALVPLPRDLRSAASTLGVKEARYLVDTYYQLQENRKASSNQERALSADEEPHATISFFSEQYLSLEKQIRSALDVFSAADPLGEWARANVGIGPVIAAGLLAHIDIAKAPTVGHIWRFAGLDPTSKWEKGKKRPWNASLKVLCWKIGDSFCKTSNNPKSFYGPLYKQRKEYEVLRDLDVMEAQGHHVEFYESVNALSMSDVAKLVGPVGTVKLDGELHTVYQLASGKFFFGGNAKVCAETLATKTFRDQAVKKKYQSGHLPDGRLEQRARRWATKLFLAHYWETGYKMMHNAPPPLPYPIAHMGHEHIISPAV